MKTEQEKRTKEERAHRLTAEDRKRISMTGVESVVSFSPNEIKLELDKGKAQIAGEGMKIVSFDKTSGSFCAEGRLDGVKYTDTFGWKGIFK